MFKVLFIFAVVLVAKQQQVEAAKSPTQVAQTLVDGAAKLTSAMVNLDKKMLKPFLQYVEREINGISTAIEGLSGSEKALVNNARSSLNGVKRDVGKVRATLRGLATTTVTKSTAFKSKLRQALQSGSDQQINLLKSAALEMKSLMATSKTALKNAHSEYYRVQQALIAIKVKLNRYSEVVNNLANSRTSKHQAAVKTLRTQAYAGAAAGAVGGPLGLLISYSIAAGVAESKIRDWKNAVNRLRSRCSQIRNNVATTVSKVESAFSALVSEEKSIDDWESDVSVLVDDFVSADDYVEFVQWDDSIKDESLSKIDSLISACRTFSSHAQSVAL